MAPDKEQCDNNKLYTEVVKLVSQQAVLNERVLTHSDVIREIKDTIKDIPSLIRDAVDDLPCGENAEDIKQLDKRVTRAAGIAIGISTGVSIVITVAGFGITLYTVLT